MSNNSKSKYLLYQKFTRRMGSDVSTSLIAGSYLYDKLLLTKEDAERELEIVKENWIKFESKFPDPNAVETTFVYIENRPEWWVSSQSTA